MNMTGMSPYVMLDIFPSLDCIVQDTVYLQQYDNHDPPQILSDKSHSLYNIKLLSVVTTLEYDRSLYIPHSSPVDQFIWNMTPPQPSNSVR